MPLVLFVSYSGAFGGAERLLVETARGLEGEICVACPDGPLSVAARAAGFHVFPLRPRSLRLRGGPAARVRAAAGLAAHGREARTLAGNLGPDLVITWGMRSAIAGLLPRLYSGPIVFHHDDFLPGRVIGALVRLAAARADCVLTPSHSTARDLDPSERLGERLVVVHPGIDASAFATEEASVDPPRVLMLGALVDWKRPDLALEACANARRTLPKLQLRLAGAAFPDGSVGLEGVLRRRAARSDLAGAVEFRGAVNDAQAELNWASCLLHCAPREPFGLVVLEALAAGRPVVAPASAGPAEIVDEQSGILYPPGDPVAAGAALVSLLSSPERVRELGAGGRARARRSFDHRAARERFAQEVMPLIGARRRPSASLEVVTVTHNSASELRALLASVERHLPGTRVVVVDSASSDESVEVARGWQGSGEVHCLALQENVGFGRGSNLGVAEVRAPVTALLNPDVELLDSSLLALSEVAAGESLPRLWAPLVLNPDGSRQDSVHPRPGSAAELWRAVLPYTRLPITALAPWRARRPRGVGWAVGCAVVARTEFFRELGPFDPSIFMYGEDLDLGLRARAIGAPTCFWPQARVVHHGAHSTAAAFDGEAFGRLAQARHQVVEGQLGRSTARRDARAQRLTFAVRVVAKRALGRPAERERHQLSVLRRAW